MFETEVEEYDHFGKPAYRVKKKIFATLWLDEKRVVVKLSPADQDSLCTEHPSAIFPVKGKWGEFGWTNVDLNKIREDVFSKTVIASWLNVAPKTLAKKYNLIPPKP